MFRWKKLGRVFNPEDESGVPWLAAFAQGPCVLHYDNFIRVYFSCRPPADVNGQYVSYSAYVDLNRTNLMERVGLAAQPILTLGAAGTFDEFGTYPVSVIRDQKKVKAYYGGWTRCESVPFNVAIGVAISEDEGKTFQRMGSGPVLSYSPDEPFILSGPKIRKFNNQWVLFYIAGKKWIPNNGRPEPVYRIRMATSDDGINWKKHNQDLIPVKLEADECQASPDVFYHEGKYHMFFCYRYSLNYRGKEGGYRIGYASSTDLVNWARDDNKAGIDISEEGWDSEMVSYPHVFELDGSIHMFYLGNQVGKSGFGVATLEGELR
jgi:sucrose-6-phosphate hydrolase SacC (GH32 family)